MVTFETYGPKVAPLGAPKINNLLKFKHDILHQIKYLLGMQMVIGLNRLYLFYNSKYILLFGYLYTVTVTAAVVYVMLSNNMTSATYIVFKNSVAIEYALLSINSLLLYKKTLKKFIEKIERFDTILNIKDHPHLASFSVPYLILFICSFVLFIIIELLYVKNVENIVNDTLINNAYFAMYLAFLCHDSEIVFFCVLLTMVMKRVKIIKGHVAKLFRKKKSTNQLEGLSYNANLDVSHLHNAYDLLHTCSEKLNSAMNLPMVLLLTISGLTSIMLLKNVFSFVQQTDEAYKHYVKYLIIFTIAYCMRFTIFVIMPCYFSNITTTQVTTIRTMLHDAINTETLGNYERRKLKAFFQLTQDSEFAYALWGVVKIDMSLPLSYCSLCVTYLIIVIQFSRFID